MNNNPKVSIITPSFNSEKTIEDTIISVLNQTYNNIEYIIVDGKSTDKTLEIIKSFEKKFNGRLKFISEKDNGIYDAINKGIKLASGEIIGILNSDDFYIHNRVIKKIVHVFINNNSDVVYADLLMIHPKKKDKVIRKFKAGAGKIKYGWFPPHPATFIKKDLYDRVGLYRTDLSIASDYEYLIRAFKNAKKIDYLEEYIIKMRLGGISNRNMFYIMKSNFEMYKALKTNGYKFPLLIVFLKLLRKIGQFLWVIFNINNLNWEVSKTI